MQHPTRRTLTISKIEPRQTSPNGHHHIDCETDAGIVAFWGSDHNLRNIQVIEKYPLPVTVTCDCIRSNWSRHDLWVPEDHTIELEPGRVPQ